ncbi:MAG: ribosome recycling factor [Acetilactobacillus jinshanensis]
MLNPNDLLKDSKNKMNKAIQSLKHKLGTVRAGRANASILSGVKADYYGVPTPINQMASITTPEPRVLTVNPYVKSSLKNITEGIMKANIGLNPTNDGSVIRIVIPQLTDERRDQLSKKVKAIGEKSKVAVRYVRRHAMDAIKKGDKNSDITDDQMHRLEDQVQKLTNQSTKGVDDAVKDKQHDIQTE